MQATNRKKTPYGTDSTARFLSIAALLIALLLTRLRLHTYHIPFAFGVLLGITLAEMDPSWAAAGTAIGCLIGEPQWSGVACAALFALVLPFARMIVPKPSPLIRMLLFCGCYVLSLPLMLLYGPIEIWYGLFGLLVSLASAVCFARSFRLLGKLKTVRLLTEWDQDALLLCWGLCILAVAEIRYSEVSLSMILILFTTMLLTSVRGLYGSFVAALLSVAWVLYAKADPRIVAVVTLGTAISVPFYREGRIWVAVGHLIASMLLIGMQPDPLPVWSLLNTVFAAILLLLLPKVHVERIESLTAIDRQLEKSTRSAMQRAHRRTARELERMGALLKDVSDTFDPQRYEREATTAWTIQGALVICLNCMRQAACWADGEAMKNTVLELASRLENAQRVVPQAPIPPDCASFADLCSSLLLAYQQALTRDAVLLRMDRQNAFTSREFSGAGEVVRRLAEDCAPIHERDQESELFQSLLTNGIDAAAIETLRAGERTLYRVYLRPNSKIDERTLLRCVETATRRRYRRVLAESTIDGVQLLLEPAPKWHVSMHVSQSALEASGNGDSYGERRKSGGNSLFALSDGMGSGEKAMAESRSAIRTLFRLYDAGMEQELVYENVNRMLMNRNGEERYATLDAVLFDLNAGTAELLKFGTPPSYLLRDTTLYTLSGEALPCGILDDVRPTVIPLQLKKGDTLFLCTDGVTDALTERLESVLLSSAPYRDSADRILRAAQETGYPDDLSVMVLRVSQ